MSFAGVPYAPGAFANGPTNYPWIYAYDIIKQDHEQGIRTPFGTQRFTDIIEMFTGGSKETPNLEYFRWEEPRLMPKIYATNGGAGAPGASVTFTANAAASQAVTYNTSPYIAAGYSKTSYVPNVDDVLLISPSGTATYDDLVHVIVLSVSTNTFVARPLNSAKSIPSLASPAEITILGPAKGEASGYPVSRDSRLTKFSNNIQVFAQEYQFTDFAKDLQTWVEVEGRDQGGIAIRGEKNQMDRMLNYIDNTMIAGVKFANVTQANTYGEDQHITTNGVFQEITDYGNIQGYGATAGVYDLDDAREISAILDLQRGNEENMVCVGHTLYSGMSKTITADTRLVNGGLVYGAVNWDADLKLKFNIDSIKIDGFIQHIKKMPSFSDVQTLGAANMPFPREGFVMPLNTFTNGDGDSQPYIRKRYKKGEEFTSFFVDYSRMESGNRKSGMRYHAYQGLEACCLTKWVRLKNAA